MADQNEHGFTHRFNRDGTVDSICRECFATVATEKSEIELERTEQNHACDPWEIERLRRGMPAERDLSRTNIF